MIALFPSLGVGIKAKKEMYINITVPWTLDVVVVVIVVRAVCICSFSPPAANRTVLANGPLSRMTDNEGDLGERHSSADRDRNSFIHPVCICSPYRICRCRRYAFLRGLSLDRIMSLITLCLFCRAPYLAGSCSEQ